MDKHTEWKRLDLRTSVPNFTGVKSGSLEHDGDDFIALNLVLQDGQTVRIRKADYGVRIEAPVVKMITKYRVTHDMGLCSDLLETREEAGALLNRAPDGARIEEVSMPLEQAGPPQPKLDDLPF